MKKKILFINPGLPMGGAEKVLITLLKNFDYSRYDVELLIVFNDGGPFFKEIPELVKLSIVYPTPNSLRQRLDFSLYYHLGTTFGEKASVMRVLKSRKYDTIVSFLEGRALKAHSYITHLAKKNISWVHTDMTRNHYTANISMRTSLEKKAYSMMDDVVFVSNDAMKQFDKLGYSVKNELVIYNPIEREFIRSFIQPPEECGIFTIALCGRLSKVKAYDRMIRIAKRLKDEGFIFQVNFIGDGAERDNLQALIEKFGVEDCVSILGYRTPPYADMARADLFVSTSIAEGYPVNICEAMCLGLPIVATRCTGTIEVLSDTDDFAVLTDQDDDGIYEAIKKMMIDNDFRNQCRKKTLLASNRFDISKTMQEVYAII